LNPAHFHQRIMNVDPVVREYLGSIEDDHHHNKIATPKTLSSRQCFFLGPRD
jgi:hypothetical protein